MINGHPVAYTPTSTRKYELMIAKAAMVAMVGRKPFSGPLSVSLRFRLPLPTKLRKAERAALLAAGVGLFGADCDNLGKSVLDALNGIVWEDDKQICRLFVTKVPSDTPGIDIRVAHAQGLLSSPADAA